MATRNKAKGPQPVKAFATTATGSTAQSKRPFVLCAGGNEVALLGESLEDAAIALEAVGIAWQDRAKKIGADGQSVSGDAILSAYMRFGEARGRIQRVLRQGVLDYGDGVGRAWMLSVSDALDSVVNELNAHNATMTDLSTELARAARLIRLANRLRAAQRELAYGHIVAAETAAEPQWSEWNTPKHWEKVFLLTWKTIKSHIKTGDLKGEIMGRRARFALGCLPSAAKKAEISGVSGNNRQSGR